MFRVNRVSRIRLRLRLRIRFRVKVRVSVVIFRCGVSEIAHCIPDLTCRHSRKISAVKYL